ncbi:MAG: hypothetical protein HKP30_06215 [Myxococcales bacterium]|nr:hypothetical protein [Myxococcales bacterium]
MAASEPIVLYGTKDHVTRITLNRPKVHNALSAELVEELILNLRRAKDDPDTRVVVLTGAGEDAFSIGGDLAGRATATEDVFGLHDAESHYTQLFGILAELGKPVIARVDGFCLSTGLGLALGCDLIVASNDSEFGTPEVKRGLMPMRVMAVLIRNCGRKKAMEMILTGERIPALEAERLGLINYAVPGEDLDTKIDKLAAPLTAASPAALRLGRDAFYHMADLEFENALSYLGALWTLNLSMEDAREGIAAFQEKRPPQWKGR